MFKTIRQYRDKRMRMQFITCDRDSDRDTIRQTEIQTERDEEKEKIQHREGKKNKGKREREK